MANYIDKRQLCPHCWIFQKKHEWYPLAIPSEGSVTERVHTPPHPPLQVMDQHKKRTAVYFLGHF